MNIRTPLLTAHALELARSLARAFAERELKHGWRTRFAPAPTGYLHLGHIVNALHVWGISRAYGGHVLLRIEDHDRTRSRQTFEHALLDDLDWLGFKPDIGATHDFRAGTTILRQSDNGDRYRAALGGLSSRGLEYGCICTRKEIAEITGDPFGAEVRYPGTCAHAGHSSAVARRVRVTDGAESFNDIRLGPQLQEPARQCGDFVIRDRNCNFTYQFCVAVDDFDQNIDLIIRGEDLLASTGRQLYLARTLGRTNAPAFLHHTLVLRPDGLKLSKSLGDTGVRELREAGESPETVLGRAAFLCGLTQAEVPLRQDDLAELFA